MMSERDNDVSPDTSISLSSLTKWCFNGLVAAEKNRWTQARNSMLKGFEPP
jgi:hypothetical protein